jgi:hypothetical protein
MSGRKLAFLAPASWIVLGAATLAIASVVQPKDDLGLYFGLAFGVACLGMGAFQLWRLARDGPKTTLYSIDDLPLEKRARALRRLILLFGAAVVVGTAFTVYQLVQVEYGWSERVTVWGPIAGLYRLLGFWPAVLFIPALGLVGLAEMARKLRAIRVTAATATKSE